MNTQQLIYLPIGVDDRSNPMPKDKDFILLFDDGQLSRFQEEDQPFSIATHWLKPTPNVYVLTEDELLDLKKKWCGEAYEAGYFDDLSDLDADKETYLNNLSLE